MATSLQTHFACELSFLNDGQVQVLRWTFSSTERDKAIGARAAVP
jgi:hypothetical protein